MTEEIKVGDWVEAKASGKKGRVLGADLDTVEVSVIGQGAWHYYRDMVRKLSFSELPPEAWDEVQRDYDKEYDKLTEDQTIKGSYIDPLTNHKIAWRMNTVEEEIKDKLKGLGWKPPEDKWGLSFPEQVNQSICTKDSPEQGGKASERQVGSNHYKKYPIQPYHYCFVNKLNNLQSEAISYITRYKDKGGKQDLEKAIHTIELLIEAEGYDDE